MWQEVSPPTPSPSHPCPMVWPGPEGGKAGPLLACSHQAYCPRRSRLTPSLPAKWPSLLWVLSRGPGAGPGQQHPPGQ